MNGIQIEHILDVVEQKSAQNRLLVRREVLSFLAQNEASILDQLAKLGEASIPTSYGSVKLTTEDLALASVA